METERKHWHEMTEQELNVELESLNQMTKMNNKRKELVERYKAIHQDMENLNDQYNLIDCNEWLKWSRSVDAKFSAWRRSVTKYYSEWMSWSYDEARNFINRFDNVELCCHIKKEIY